MRVAMSSARDLEPVEAMLVAVLALCGILIGPVTVDVVVVAMPLLVECNLVAVTRFFPPPTCRRHLVPLMVVRILALVPVPVIPSVMM
jgi:hypothetical protein